MKDYGDSFNISHIEPSSEIYGPGKRFVIWFQGCSLACDGCWNEEMWSFKDNILMQKQDVLERILSTPGVQGVTFLGGEPLHQAENLWWLIRQIRQRSDLTIFLFTGYEKHELDQLNFSTNIEELCDMIAIGRYESAYRNITQQWVGSDNQAILYPEGSREVVRPEPINQVEIIIKDDGAVTVLGFPSDDLLNCISD